MKPLKYYIYDKVKSFGQLFSKSFQQGEGKCLKGVFFFSEKNAKGHGRPRSTCYLFFLRKAKVTEKNRPLRGAKSGPLALSPPPRLRATSSVPHESLHTRVLSRLLDFGVAVARTASVILKKRGTNGATRKSRFRFFCWSERPTRPEAAKQRVSQAIADFFFVKSRGQTYINNLQKKGILKGIEFDPF